jgi:hypothetical protein
MMFIDYLKDLKQNGKVVIIGSIIVLALIVLFSVIAILYASNKPVFIPLMCVNIGLFAGLIKFHSDIYEIFKKEQEKLKRIANLTN